MKISENSLRDLWENIMQTNIQITEVPAENEKKKIMRRYLMRSQLKPLNGKGNNHPSPGSPESPIWDNPKRNMPRHILIKLTKIKHKEQILKEAREKQQVTYKGISMKLTPGSFRRISSGQKRVAGYT